MKKSTRQTLAAMALTSLAVSMIGCQSGGLNPVGEQNQIAPKVRINRLSAKASSFARQGYMPGELIVKFRQGASAQAMSNTMKTLGVVSLQNLGHPRMGISLVKLKNGAAMAQTLQGLRSNPAVQYAEPNFIVQLPRLDAAPLRLNRLSEEPPVYPNDEMFEQQYAHKLTQSQKGWEVNKGSENVVVAVVDTGVDLKHPDLADKLTQGRDIVDSDDDPMDGQGHGTHCAGIAAALTDNGVGVAGYAPGVKVMPVRVLDDQGSGTYADVTNGILWAADHGAHVISMSLGGPSSSKALEEAIKYSIEEKDVLVIAAMGNSGNNSKSYPAAIPGVMAIGATDSKDKIAYFSQYGEWISVSAPGVGILSTFPTYSSGMPGKNYGSISGTSMATPAVAGLAGLVRSQFPDMNQLEARAQIEKNTDDLGDNGFDIHYGHGRINVAKALSNAPAGQMMMMSRNLPNRFGR